MDLNSKRKMLSLSPCDAHAVTAVSSSLSQLVHCVHLACLPASTLCRRVTLSVAPPAILACHQNPDFPAFQCVLRTNNSPGILHAFSARLELLRHPSASRTEQLLGFQPLQCADSCCWVTRLYCVSQSSKAPMQDMLIMSLKY